MNKKIFAISGSTRQNSTNQAILKYISDLFSTTIEVEIFRKLDEIPHFSPDLDNANPPQIIAELRNSIKEADAVIISTPEYIYSLPGGLKNLIDWNVSTTIFNNKPVAIIVASASGKKAFESLDLVMSTITVTKIPDNLKLLISGLYVSAEKLCGDVMGNLKKKKKSNLVKKELLAKIFRL